jgi:hypothetical protein
LYQSITHRAPSGPVRTFRGAVQASVDAKMLGHLLMVGYIRMADQVLRFRPAHPATDHAGRHR